jgi:hypothetical protein
MTRKVRVTDGDDGVWDVQRYEQLRSHSLDGEPSGFRLGRVLLERRGVAAWARAWGSTAHGEPAPCFQQATATACAPPPVGDALVGALASMALARVAAG